MRPSAVITWLRRALRLVGYGVLVVMLALWVVSLRPQVLGGPASYILVSGQSMEPTLHSGDLAIVLAQSQYERGDIVAYRLPEGDPGAGQLVIHRILWQLDDGTYLMQGDNTSGVDIWKPAPAQVVGRVWVFVPQMGDVLAAVRSPLFVGSFAALLCLWVILGRDPAHDARRGSRARSGA